MEQSISAEVSSTLEEVAEAFRVWRRTRQHRGRIPNRLWDAAIALTTSYPASKIAETLHLNYSELKKRMEPSSASPLSFVEVGLSPAGSNPSLPSCQLEVETVRGSRFRCQIHGPVDDKLLHFIQNLL
jgi:hypothetical protein